ncbi:hypothetical protein BT69DRAFT_1003911 [Atractiella rhizophila]|nr:hypothetical protein BT69DRAFT_1003911 [Atractiella rhizophila]
MRFQRLSRVNLLSYYFFFPLAMYLEAVGRERYRKDGKKLNMSENVCSFSATARCCILISSMIFLPFTRNDAADQRSPCFRSRSQPCFNKMVLIKRFQLFSTENALFLKAFDI